MPRRQRAIHHRTSQRHRARDGRLLIECIVAMMLLAVAGLSLTAGTRAITSLADDALLVAHAQAASSTAAEQALALACDSTGRAPSIFGARIAERSTDTRSATLRTRDVAVTIAPAPLSARDTQRLSLSTARSCQ